MNSLKLMRGLVQNNFSLQFGNKFQFGMRTSAQTLIYGKKPEQDIKYSREYFQLRGANPNYDQEQKQLAREQMQKQLTEKFFENKFNDKNAKNIIPVKVNNQYIGGTAKIRQKREFNLQNTQNSEGQKANPFILIHKPREPKVTVTGIRRNIPSTLKKLRNPMKIIGKRQVFDALSILETVGSKASRYVILALKQTINHAKQKDMDVNRLYVNGAMMGKQRRFKLLFYKAKAQHGILTKDICQVRITLEEKPIKDMYKEIIVGKTPPSLAFLLREKLKNEQADYETLRQWSHVLTAKGRQQRRLMFKRKVIQKQQEYARQGVRVEKKVIAKKILEVESTEWEQKYEQRRLEIDQASINKRMAVYKKNEQITGFN